MNTTSFTTLFISSDPTIFDSQSPARARMRTYAKEIGTLHILSRGKGAAIVREDVGNASTLVLHAVNETGLRSLKPFLFLEMKKRAQRLITQERIQIVSAQDPFEYGWIAMKAVRGTKAKLHIQIHTDPFSPWFTKIRLGNSTQIVLPLINRIRQSIAGRVLLHADGIRVVSKRVRDELIQRYGTRIPVPVVMPVIVSLDIPPAVPLPEHRFSFALMFVGRLEPEKRIDDILKALAVVSKTHTKVGLVVVGEGRERTKLEKLANTLGIREQVQFLGWRTDSWGLMQSAQAYIQASGYEGYSRTLLEAALANLPIITTDVGIVGEVFKSNESALVVLPANPSTFAKRIIELVENTDLRIGLAKTAQNAAREHILNAHTSPSDIAQDLRKLLYSHE